MLVLVLLSYYLKIADNSSSSSSSDDDSGSGCSDSEDTSNENGMGIETKNITKVELIKVKSKKQLAKLVRDSFLKERLKAVTNITKNSTIKTTTISSVPIPKGTFYNFILNICNVIVTRFPSRKIEKYFPVLGDSLKKQGSGYFMRKKIDEFRKTIIRLKVYHGRILRELVKRFLSTITKRTQMKYEFFTAMNSLFTITEENRLDDYIYDLKRYADDRISRMGARTRLAFRKIIFRIFYKQEENVRDDIKLKFKLAWVEYLEGLRNKER